MAKKGSSRRRSSGRYNKGPRVRDYVLERIRNYHWTYKRAFLIATVMAIAFLAVTQGPNSALLVKRYIWPPQLPLQHALVQSLDEIHDSQILFNPPEKMDQGKTERIEARISYRDISDAIYKDLKGRGDPYLETVRVGEKMTVILSGDKDEFAIQKYSSDEQLVAGRPFAQWEWNVKPISYGELTLHLKAIINLRDSEGNDAAQDIPVIDRQIKVMVNPAFIAAQAARNKEVWNIVFGSGVGVLVIGGLIAAIRTWRKRRSSGWQFPP